ncbi:acyl-CoA dehydrogenase family protein [Streptomyces sp. SD15]
MDFQPNDDQRALRAGVRELLTARFGPEQLRAAVRDRPDGRPRLDGALWRELGEAGFFALRLPEADGGVGLGLPEAVLAFEEAGRVLLPGPLVATHLAAGVAAGAATGEAVVTAVDGGGLVEWLEEADVVRGVGEGRDGGVVRDGDVVGEAGVVRDGNVVRDAGVVRGDVVGAEPLRSVDPLTPLHRVPVAAPHGASVSVVAASTDVLLTSLLTAAEQLGTAARTCEMAVQHARTREQFGRPIGAFQAVQHLCARMLVRVEVARAAVYAAAVTADPLDVAAARLLADEAAVRGARDCLQVHGGMGFTWESDVHLYLKRAWVRTQRGGSDTESEDLLAADLLAGTAQ